MSELGRDARDFLASARGAHDAEAGAKERVRAGLAAALTVSAGAGGAVTLAPVGARSAWATAAKLATVIAIVGGGAWFLLGRQGSGARSVAVDAVLPPAAPLRVASGPSATSAANAPHLNVAPSQNDPVRSVVALSPPSANAVPVVPAHVPVSPVSRPTSAVASEGSVAAEVAILQRASAALRASDPESALAAVSEHARRFPNGALAEERETERVVALCALGRSDDAARARTRFERAYPGSTHAARVQAACGRPGVRP